MLDFGRYVDILEDRTVWITANEIRKLAKEKVRKDKRNLENSIIATDLGDGMEVSANTEYAAAQEWGRPDLPQYGFTPYMRPAVKEAAAKIPEFARRAAEIAARMAS